MFNPSLRKWVGRFRATRGWYAASLIALFACSPSAERSKTELVLETIKVAPIADMGILTGASVDSAGEVVIWASSGALFAFAEDSSSLLAVKRPAASLRWNTVAVRPGTRGQVYAALDSQTLHVVQDTLTVGSYRVRGRLRAVTANPNELIYASSDSLGGIDVYTARWKRDSADTTYISLGAREQSARLTPISVQRVGKRLVLAGAADSLVVYCAEAGGTRTNRQANAVRYVGDELQNHVPLWKVASMVALDSGFLVSIADLRSSRRRIARYDDECRQVTDSEVPDGFVPAATSPSGALLVGTRAVRGGEVVVMKWRWQAAK